MNKNNDKNEDNEVNKNEEGKENLNEEMDNLIRMEGMFGATSEKKKGREGREIFPDEHPVDDVASNAFDFYESMVKPMDIGWDEYILEELEKAGVTGNPVLVALIYKHYGFLYENIRVIITAKEGLAFSNHKTQWVISAYEAMARGKMDELNMKSRWIPKSMNADFWLNLCTGLIDLQYGQPAKYLKVMELLK